MSSGFHDDGELGSDAASSRALVDAPGLAVRAEEANGERGIEPRATAQHLLGPRDEELRLVRGGEPIEQLRDGVHRHAVDAGRRESRPPTCRAAARSCARMAEARSARVEGGGTLRVRRGRRLASRRRASAEGPRAAEWWAERRGAPCEDCTRVRLAIPVCVTGPGRECCRLPSRSALYACSVTWKRSAGVAIRPECSRPTGANRGAWVPSSGPGGSRAGAS